MDYSFLYRLVVGITVFAVLAVSAGAVEFRVENRIFSAGEKKPVSVSLTLFQDGAVYDFLKKPAETTVYESNGRFHLLDMTRRKRTEITDKQIDIFLEQVRQRVLKHTDPAVRFYALPQFEEHFDPSNNTLLLSSQWVTYRILTKEAESPSQAMAYREFADSSMRLNSLLDPRSRPPFARLKVNEALAKRKHLPHEVSLTIVTRKDNASRQTSFRSEHHFSSTLNDSDRGQITLARKALSQYEVVDFTTYRKAAP